MLREPCVGQPGLEPGQNSYEELVLTFTPLALTFLMYYISMELSSTLCANQALYIYSLTPFLVKYSSEMCFRITLPIFQLYLVFSGLITIPSRIFSAIVDLPP